MIEAVFQFQLFGQAQLLTGGGPNNASRPLVQFIYESGFRQWLFGYSAAAAQDRRRVRPRRARNGQTDARGRSHHSTRGVRLVDP
ncbi:hypothetical protein [Paraburkholderia sp. BR14374]|uniref:hypothetical protein n=1 Tax=Paraburkholderia sp. BR14374 TaxID=3237007 RepID=UPI0034CD265C